MKRALLKKWERYASEELTRRREVRRLHPSTDDAMAARIALACTQIALNRLERQIARAAYLEAFGVKPTVALVTRKRGAK